MKPIPWRGVLLIVAVVAVFAMRYWRSSRAEIKYQGQTIKLSKRYPNYEDYKDDPNNLNTNELGRIEQLITEARLPSSFSTDSDFARAVFKLKFPGYGCGARGGYPQIDGSTCLVFFVEIPLRDKERYFIGRTSGARVSVVDDFVLSLTTNELNQVKIDGTQIRYFDDRGYLLREKQLSQ